MTPTPLFPIDSLALAIAHAIYPADNVAYEFTPKLSEIYTENLSIKNHCFKIKCPVKIGISISKVDLNLLKETHVLREKYKTHHKIFPYKTQITIKNKKSEIVFRSIQSIGPTPNYIDRGDKILFTAGPPALLCIDKGEYALEILTLESGLTRPINTVTINIVNDFKAVCK